MTDEVNADEELNKEPEDASEEDASSSDLSGLDVVDGQVEELSAKEEDAPADQPEPDPEVHAKHAKINLPIITDDDIARDEGFVLAGDETRAFDMGDGAKGHSKAGKILLIVFGAIVGLLLVIYLAGAFYFSNRFFPNTYLGNTDISFQTTDEIESILKTADADYSLDLDGYGFQLTITTQQAGFDFHEGQFVEQIKAAQNPFTWPVEFFSQHDMGEALKGTYNSEAVEKLITEAVEKHNQKATPTTNAAITYDSNTKQFVVTPEEYGTQLDVESVIAFAEDAIEEIKTTAKLTQDQLVQPTVTSEDGRFAKAVESANAMCRADVSFTLAETEVVHLTADISHSWITINEDYEVSIDEDAIGAWAEEVASSCDTVGSTRTFTRSDGKEYEVTGGDYGWKVNHDQFVWMVKTDVNEGNVGSEEIPTTSQATAFNGVGKADWGKRYIDVDLTEQHVWFYDSDGEYIWESDCVSGSTLVAGRATPPGVYTLTTKESPSKLIGYENGEKIYETTVTYWMPFEGNSVGFHDATWQSAFGGERYKEGYGSHGCINLPYDAAKELYDIIDFEIPIVVHY